LHSSLYTKDSTACIDTILPGDNKDRFYAV